MGFTFVSIYLPNKLNMTKNSTHITVSSMLLWRNDCLKSAVFLLGTPGEDCEKGVFIEKDFFEPFYVPKLLNKMPKSKVIKLFNKN